MNGRNLYDRRRFLWLMFSLRFVQFTGCAVCTGWLIWAWRSGETGFPFIAAATAFLSTYFAWEMVREWRKPR